MKKLLIYGLSSYVGSLAVLQLTPEDNDNVLVLTFTISVTGTHCE